MDTGISTGVGPRPRLADGVYVGFVKKEHDSDVAVTVWLPDDDSREVHLRFSKRSMISDGVLVERGGKFRLTVKGSSLRFENLDADYKM